MKHITTFVSDGEARPKLQVRCTCDFQSGYVDPLIAKRIAREHRLNHKGE